MARYAVERHLLEGLSREDVIKKLGSANTDRGFNLQYNLGPHRGWISMDGCYLDIRFDESGRVRDVKIRVS